MTNWILSSSDRSTSSSITTNLQKTSPKIMQKISLFPKASHDEADFFYYDATIGSIEKKNHEEVIFVKDL